MTKNKIGAPLPVEEARSVHDPGRGLGRRGQSGQALEFECLGADTSTHQDIGWGDPQSHRMYPELHLPLEIFTVGGGEGAQKGRLQSVAGKYLKFFFLYENSHG